MLRTMATLLVVAAAAASSSTAKLPNIIQIVADDLGMDDLGAAGQLGNGGLTRTPAINKLIETGVALDHYYTFKVCAPTRTSLMTGRYPYMTGYYDMDNDGNHCVASNMTMVPAHLKKLGYATHAIGKWDVGYIKKECTPTYRG